MPPDRCTRSRPSPRLSTPWRAAAAALLALTAHAARADGSPFDGDRLRLSGFATVGGVYSDVSAPWQFRRDVLQRPTSQKHGVQGTVDSRLGLQANWQIADDWEAVLQGVLKPIAQEAPLEQRLEWAFLSYRPAPGWETRFGRVSTDNYLESQYSSVGYAYPWVRPNMEFYGWTSLSAVDGLDLTRIWDAGSTRWRMRVGLGQAKLAVPAPANTQISFVGRDLLSTSLSAEEGGLLVKASYVQMNVSFDSSVDHEPLLAGLRNVENLPAVVAPAALRDEARRLREGVPAGTLASRYAAISVQYRAGPWLTQAELSHAITGNISETTHVTGSTAYRSGEWTWFGTAGRSSPKDAAAATPQWQGALTPTVGPVVAAQLQMLGSVAAQLNNIARIQQRSVGAGVRWDFRDRAALKVQLDRFKVYPSGSALWGNGTPEARRANVLSVVVDTVF